MKKKIAALLVFESLYKKLEKKVKKYVIPRITDYILKWLFEKVIGIQNTKFNKLLFSNYILYNNS